MTPLDTLAARLLDAARMAGAEAADALVVRGSQSSVDVRGGRLEEAQRAEGIDLGLRVLIGRRQAVVSSSDATLSWADLRCTLRSAIGWAPVAW